MKKIVVFCDNLPFPYDNGIKIPLYHFIKGISTKYNVLVICVANESKRSIDVAQNEFKNIGVMLEVFDYKTKGKVGKFFSALLRLTPHYVFDLNFKFKSRILKKISEFSPDCIYLDMPSLSRILDLKHDIGNDVKWFYAPNDSLSLGFLNEIREKRNIKRLKSFVDYFKSLILERKILKTVNRSFFVSELDRQFVIQKHRIDIEKVYMISNGVDSSLYLPKEKEKYLLFVGGLDGGNANYLKRFIENVYSKLPIEIRWSFKVVGKTKRTDLLKLMNETSGIEYLGFVDDISALYSHAFCVISPVRKNSGIINKVLEGLSSGAVVVGYKNSFSGLINADDQKEAYIEVDDDITFINILNHIFSEPKLYESYFVNSREYILAHYSWEDRYQKYMEFLDGK